MYGGLAGGTAPVNEIRVCIQINARGHPAVGCFKATIL